MRQRWSDSWLPTVLFVVVFALLGRGGARSVMMGLSALLITPMLWSWFIRHRSATGLWVPLGAANGLAVTLLPGILGASASYGPANDHFVFSILGASGGILLGCIVGGFLASVVVWLGRRGIGPVRGKRAPAHVPDFPLALILSRTWKPTALFVLVMTLMVCWADVQWGLSVAAASLVLTPPLWWLLVGRKRRPEVPRGAIAGALIGALIHLAPMLYVLNPERNKDAGLAGLALIFVALAGLVAVVVGAALGAVIGGFVVRAESRVTVAAASS